MHIGVLTHNYPRFPGDFSGTFVEALCQEFANQGQQVTVWAPFDPAYQQTGRQEDKKTRSELDTISNQQSTIHKPTLHLYRYAYPDRLHTLGYMRSMQSDLSLKLSNYFLSPFFFAAGIAKVLSDAKRQRPDLLHAHWLLPNGFIAAVVARRLGIPLAISVPGSDAQVANANPLFRTMARFALRQANLLTANSEELRDAVLGIVGERNREVGGWGDKEIRRKFDLILYGTDPNALKPDQAGVAELRHQLVTHSPHHPTSSPSCLLLCVGRMVYKKGFDYLLRALAEPELRQRNVLAVMVGNGDQKEEWQALAQQVGIADRVCWVGNVPKTEIGVYYNACDILLNPSVSKPADGLNVCVLDAMSCSKPVVGSNVAGNALAIVDGETGLIVPEQDASALAKALATLVDNKELRQRMGQAARRRIETELGWPPLAKRYLAHFEQIAGKGTDQ
ncbi:MAG: glycosyltransferase [Caldilineaceae bacterium]